MHKQPIQSLRHPITLRRLIVQDAADLGRRMRRITLGGDQIGPFGPHPAMDSRGPDDHVKLFFPDPSGRLILPRQGDGRLHWPEDPPAISREYTPRGFRPGGPLILDFVLHGVGGTGPHPPHDGPASHWAATAKPGDEIFCAGPRTSLMIPEWGRYTLIGDRTALPAVANWLDALPQGRAKAHLLAHAEDYPDLAGHGDVTWWGDGPLADDLPLEGFVWAGAEAQLIARLRGRLADRPTGTHKLSVYWTA